MNGDHRERARSILGIAPQASPLPLGTAGEAKRLQEPPRCFLGRETRAGDKFFWKCLFSLVMWNVCGCAHGKSNSQARLWVPMCPSGA